MVGSVGIYIGVCTGVHIDVLIGVYAYIGVNFCVDFQIVIFFLLFAVSIPIDFFFWYKPCCLHCYCSDLAIMVTIK